MRSVRWMGAVLGAVMVLMGTVRAEVTIITTNPVGSLPQGFLPAAQALSNEWTKPRPQMNPRVVTDRLKEMRVMAAVAPTDGDVQCWLGVANLLMAERMRKPVNKLKYNKAATAALYATKTADPENVCWQCVMISTMKQFNDLSKRSQFSATDAQCGMLTPPLN